MKKYCAIYVLLLFVLLQACHESKTSDSNVPLKTIADRYIDWLGSFNKDFKSLVKIVNQNRDHRTIFAIEMQSINRTMQSSVVPDSIMSSSLMDMIDNKELGPFNKLEGPTFSIPLYRDLLPFLLQKARPAGIGGTYKPSKDGIIVYFKIDLPKEQNPYKDNKIPKNGHFARNQKSFAVYKLEDGRLKLWVLSKEFFNILNLLRKTEVDKAREEFKGLLH